MGRFVPDKESGQKNWASRFIQVVKIMNKHSDAYFCPSPYDRELLLSELSKFFETKFRKLWTMSDASRSEMLNSLNTLTEISARGLLLFYLVLLEKFVGFFHLSLRVFEQRNLSFLISLVMVSVFQNLRIHVHLIFDVKFFIIFNRH